MENCTFCEELLKAIDNDEYYNKPHEHTVALISRYYYDGYVCGQLTHTSKPLNFCPVCGKKLNLNEIRKKAQDKYNEAH